MFSKQVYSIVFALLCITAYTNAQCTYYTLTSGQTFTSISNGATTLINDLINMNPTVNSNTAGSGTTICIPTATYSSYNLGTGGTTSGCTYYTMTAGQTFASLSGGSTTLQNALISR